MTASLERELVALGSDLEIPDAPDFAATITLPARRRSRRGRLPGRAVAAVGFATLALAGSAMAVPVSRHVVLSVLGLRGATIERVPALPPLPRGTPARLHLGRRIPLADARTATAFTPLLPAHPDAAYIAHDVTGGRLSLLVASQLVIELRAGSQPFFLKLIDPGTSARLVRVGRDPGVYLSGSPHQLLYENDGRVRTDTVRLAGNVLLWQRGAVTIRIEGARSLAAALALARSLR